MFDPDTTRAQSRRRNGAKDRLTGSLPTAEPKPDSWLHALLQQITTHIALHFAVGPLILFTGAVLVAGAWGLAGKLDQLRGGRGHGEELWPCFPAALAIVLIAIFIYRYFRRVRNRTIHEFEYDNGQFSYRTPENDAWIRQTSAFIRSMRECPGMSDCVRIRFDDGRWVVVTPQLENSCELLQRLARDRTAYQYRST